MIGIVSYIVVFLFTFFVGSFMVAHNSYKDPTEPHTFIPLVGASLVWPITIPLVVITLLLIGIAKLAIILSIKRCEVIECPCNVCDKYYRWSHMKRPDGGWVYRPWFGKHDEACQPHKRSSLKEG